MPNSALNAWLSPEGVAAVAAVIALSGIYVEYVRQKRAHSVELAQQMLEHLNQDEMVNFALLCLDWGAGAIPTPKRWREVVGTPSVEADPHSVLEATQCELTKAVRDDPVKLLFRHAFVALFDHLERITQLFNEGVIEARDLRAMAWVAENLACWPYAPIGKERNPFGPAIEGWYEKDGIMPLLGALSDK